MDCGQASGLNNGFNNGLIMDFEGLATYCHYTDWSRM